MNTRIKATNITLTDGITDYLDKKMVHVKKFLEREEGMIADVELGKTTEHHKNGDVFRAEIMITGNGIQVRAEAQTSDLHSSIDKVQDQIIQELKTKHNKGRSKFRRGAAAIKRMLRGGGDA